MGFVILRNLLLLILFSGCIFASHFRGGYLSYKIVRETTTTYDIKIFDATAWRSNFTACSDRPEGDTREIVPLVLTTVSSSNTVTINGETLYNCNVTSTENLFRVGYHSTEYNGLLKSEQYELALQAPCCWIELPCCPIVKFILDNNVRVVTTIPAFSTTANSPPIPYELVLYEVPTGTVQKYIIPLVDIDGDDVRCRKADNVIEGGAIGLTTEAAVTTLNGQCEVTIDATTKSIGSFYPVAIIIEDFSSTTSTTALHSIPYQLIYYVIADNNIASFCQSYTLLTDTERNVLTGRSRSCDSMISETGAWYRFGGPAGSRLATTCPSTANPSITNRCSTGTQAWTKDQLPAVSQTPTTINLCISNDGSCDCDPNLSPTALVVNCGGYYVYFLTQFQSCEAVHCGEAIDNAVNLPTASCTPGFMTVVLPQAYFGPIVRLPTANEVTLLQSTCASNLASTNYILSTSLIGCGTTFRETSTHLVYENAIVVQSNGSPTVTARITLSCYFQKFQQTDLDIAFAPTSLVQATEENFGQFVIEIRAMNLDFSQVINLPQISYLLGEVQYCEILVVSSNPDVVIIADRVFATSETLRTGGVSHDLILDRCPKDGTVTVSNQNSNKDQFRFSFKGFAFTSDVTKPLYLHSDTFLCHRSSTDVRCNTQCPGLTGNNVNGVSRISRRSIVDESDDGIVHDEPSKLYQLAAGPFLSRDIRNVRAIENTNKETLRLDTSASPILVSMTAYGALFVCVFVIVVPMAAYFRRKQHFNH